MSGITVIPNRHSTTLFDRWMAYSDCQKCHSYGYGRTAMEARADFIRLQDEEYCSQVCPQERREGEDCALNGGCPLARKS